jgi:hypothetical protein
MFRDIIEFSKPYPREKAIKGKNEGLKDSCVFDIRMR